MVVPVPAQRSVRSVVILRQREFLLELCHRAAEADGADQPGGLRQPHIRNLEDEIPDAVTT
jgi:hypothetical protein